MKPGGECGIRVSTGTGNRRVTRIESFGEYLTQTNRRGCFRNVCRRGFLYFRGGASGTDVCRYSDCTIGVSIELQASRANPGDLRGYLLSRVHCSMGDHAGRHVACRRCDGCGRNPAHFDFHDARESCFAGCQFTAGRKRGGVPAHSLGTPSCCPDRSWARGVPCPCVPIHSRMPLALDGWHASN